LELNHKYFNLSLTMFNTFQVTSNKLDDVKGSQSTL